MQIYHNHSFQNCMIGSGFGTSTFGAQKASVAANAANNPNLVGSNGVGSLFGQSTGTSQGGFGNISTGPSFGNLGLQSSWNNSTENNFSSSGFAPRRL